MGAVQKLATVVIVGLVGLATLLVVYLANENNRREAEAEEQREVAITRGIETYLQNCLVCHGPAGEGYTVPGEEETGRIGAPLGGNTEAGRSAMELNQVVDPINKDARARELQQILHNGRGLMPAWGDGAEGGALLNDEQINELVLMIQEVDWDLVYNDAIEANDGEYPTPPPAAETEEDAAAQDAEADGEAAAADGGAGGTEFTVESVDIDFNPNELTIPANTDVTINLPNNGAGAHNFAIDALDISVDQPPGAEEQVTINAAAGEYEYYCNVPGHKEAGMVGTLIVSEEAAAGDGDAAATEDEGDAAEGATADPAEAPAADTEADSSDAAEAVTVESVDIAFNPKELTIPANTDVTVNLPNNGAAAHNFAIDALDISVDQPPGAEEQITINAEPGEYEYYCNVPGHRAAGMVGTLTVE